MRLAQPLNLPANSSDLFPEPRQMRAQHLVFFLDRHPFPVQIIMLELRTLKPLSRRGPFVVCNSSLILEMLNVPNQGAVLPVYGGMGAS